MKPMGRHIISGFTVCGSHHRLSPKGKCKGCKGTACPGMGWTGQASSSAARLLRMQIPQRVLPVHLMLCKAAMNSAEVQLLQHCCTRILPEHVGCDLPQGCLHITSIGGLLNEGVQGDTRIYSDNLDNEANMTMLLFLASMIKILFAAVMLKTAVAMMWRR